MPLWPWWLGALAFTAVAVSHLVVLRRPLGVSGLLRTAISPEKWRDERDANAVDDDDMQRALEEATRPAFGGASLPITSVDNEVSSAGGEKPPPPLGWSQSVIFLVGLVGGGALAAGLQPDAAVELLPTGLFDSVYGAFAIVALVVGGVFVGFGTAMSGGCTSGHGLVGVARLQAPSLVATACFFGIGIVLSLLMKALGLFGM
jgi:uncharacterized membrane protein YedE/YeeE